MTPLRKEMQNTKPLQTGRPCKPQSHFFYASFLKNLEDFGQSGSFTFDETFLHSGENKRNNSIR